MKFGRIAISMLLTLCLLCGMACAEDLTGILVNSRTAQAFTDEPVSEDDLNTILQAGLAATSAINQQPWYFAAVTDQSVIDDIKASAGGFGGAPAGMKPGDKPEGAPDGAPAGDMPAPPKGGMPGGGAKAGLGDSPVAIIVYMNGDTMSPNAAFDCGLACENMFIAARALGYGAKIVSSPTMQLNGDDHDALCEKLGVDTAYTAVAVLLVGHEATDATSGASERSPMDEKVSIVK